MKRFKEHLINEDFDPAIYNSDGAISIDDPTVVDGLNANLEKATARPFRTPYNALEEIRKILEYYKIFLPKSVFLDRNHGNDVFQISQFGEKTGMNNQGEVVTAHDSSLFVYFEWSMNDHGSFDIFCSIANEEELDDLISDYESEDDDLQEEAMPNLKKKMGAKKVTLPNMMRKEETLDEASHSFGEHGKMVASAINHFGTKDHPEADESNLHFFSNKYVKSVLKKAHKHVTPEYKDKLTSIISGLKEETLNEKAKWRKDKEANPTSVNPRNDVLKPIPGKKMRSGIGTWLADGKRKTPVQGHANEPNRKGHMTGPRKGAVLPEETINEIADTKKGKIVLKKVIDKAFKKYYDAYDSETDARAEVQKKRTPESRKGAENARAVKIKAKDRVVRFQQYADKKNTVKEDKAPFDNPTEKPSTPYKNLKAKAKQLARAAAKKAKSKQLDEARGRPSQRHPLEGHEYHRKSDAELIYIGKDAHKAAEAMKGHNEKAESKYLDQANDAATVRHFRQRSGTPNWYKEKYGHNKK